MEKLAYYWKRLRKNRLAYNLVLIGAIILAMAVAAHIVMQVGTRHGARRTVPDFSGVKLDQAQRMARKYDLKLHINDSLFVPAYEGGIVLDQLPEGGVEVKPGRTVYITINSFRQKMVPVPYVAGRSLRQAKNMLEIAGLEIDELVYRADMATNYVLDEYCDGRPVAATSKIEAELGSGVTLYVGVEGGYGTTVVPRLVGFPLKEAKGRLWELGLNVGKVDFDEVLYDEGDCFARYMVRMREIEQSMDIIEQLIDNIPEGEYQLKMKPVIRIPEGSYYAAVEGSRGEFGVFIESRGEKSPYRMKFRSTGLPLVSCLETIARGTKIADLIAIGGTLDYVVPDIDR